MASKTHIKLNVDEAELTRAIRACEEEIALLDVQREELLLRAQTYRQLLRLQMGKPQVDMTGRRIVYIDKEAKAPVRSVRPVSIAEAAAGVLAEAPSGKMHAKELLAALEAAGRKVQGKAPGATLFSILRRSPDRFDRVPGEANTWRLKKPGTPRKQVGEP